MALQAVVDSLEKIPEALKAEYTKGDDGKFRLAVEGLPQPEDTTGLKSALAAERKLRADAATKVKAWDALGKSPEEIQNMLSTAEAEALEKSKKKGDFDSILKQHTEKSEKDKAAVVAERDEARSFAQNAVRSTGIQGALAKSKATPEGLDLLVERLGQRVQVEISGGKATTKIMSADGTTPMAGSGPDGSATYDDLVKEAVKQYPSLFEGTGAGGGGKPPKNGAGGSGKTISRSDFEALGPLDRASKLKEGVKVVD